MKASDKINLLLKGVSMKDIKELETQEQEEAAAAEEPENQEESNEETNEPEEESEESAVDVDKLTEAVAEAVVKKLQLDNLHLDREGEKPAHRSVEQIAASIYTPKKKQNKKN